MARYIDAEELCRRLNECWETNDIDKGRVIQHVIDRVITPIVVGTPTADVVEVKRGHWVSNRPNPDAMKKFHELGIGKAMSIHSVYWTCSECGMWGTPSGKFCSECGAKMMGGNDGKSI